MTTRPAVSVVIPVYNNEASLTALVAELGAVSGELANDLEAVFVVDGSPDASERILSELLPNAGFPSRVLTLSRNFGSFSAIRTGLAHANGTVVVVISADLQEPPAIIHDFLRGLEDPQIDVAVGRRRSRRDPFRSRVHARIFWAAYRRWVNADIPEGGVDVFACRLHVARHLASFTEVNTSLVGLLYWLGYQRGVVDYDRMPRHSGRSAWSAAKKVRYLFDSVFAFTQLPILILQRLGLIGLTFSAATGLAVFAAWMVGAVDSPGYTPLMLVVTGSTSSILLALGVIGSYVWRIYDNGKHRPVAVVARLQDFGTYSQTSEAQSL